VPTPKGLGTRRATQPWTVVFLKVTMKCATASDKPIYRTPTDKFDRSTVHEVRILACSQAFVSLLVSSKSLRGLLVDLHLMACALQGFGRELFNQWVLDRRTQRGLEPMILLVEWPFCSLASLGSALSSPKMAPLDLKPEHDLREASKNNRTCNGLTENRRLFHARLLLRLKRGHICMRKLRA
jgi:hypothetical protein